ncbi:nucleotidyltransferase domain-containing protein [Patescibacteria group bacterium]|nr:nucleotidyltransferase domain-containing protein [Patescibacteria group bacterium]
MLEYNKNQIKTARKKYSLDFIVLFGSSAKEVFKKTSDIDIAIKSPSPIGLKQYSEIQSEIAKAFKTKSEKIDLIEILYTSPILMRQIAKYGRLLAGNFLEFKKFQAATLKKYFDTKKFRDLTKRYIIQNLYAR